MSSQQWEEWYVLHVIDEYVFNSLQSLPKDFNEQFHNTRNQNAAVIGGANKTGWVFTWKGQTWTLLRIQCFPVGDADIRVLNDNPCVKTIIKVISSNWTLLLLVLFGNYLLPLKKQDRLNLQILSCRGRCHSHMSEITLTNNSLEYRH